MHAFTAYDGTELTFDTFGDGSPVVCLPGGPMQDCVYLGDLGGLSAHRRLIMLDPRGSGGSATPEDPASYRCDRLVDDVEALREHLGLDRMDLLAHSAGTNLAMLYAQRHPDRVARLALITPSVHAVGIEITPEVRRATALLRQDEPWFPEASAALEAIVAGEGDADAFRAIAPFWYGRWDEAARAHRDAEDAHKNHEGAARYADGAFAPDVTRAALARLASSVLVLAGEVDLNSPPPAMAEVAALFPHAELVVQSGAGHFPWLDDPDPFVTTTAAFLERPAFQQPRAATVRPAG
ncbi:alpha/beta hydrolase [Streptomyces sp. NPDC002935]|uniref:alpha/beta fold hydrolase n=1 Tax=unclassified Streptomyces TaxID=2593676 RepID=UPI00332A8662